MSEIEPHYKITEAAKLAGVSNDTFRRWIEESGLSFNRGGRGRGRAAIIPKSIVQRIISEHSIRLAAL